MYLLAALICVVFVSANVALRAVDDVHLSCESCLHICDIVTTAVSIAKLLEGCVSL